MRSEGPQVRERWRATVRPHLRALRVHTGGCLAWSPGPGALPAPGAVLRTPLRRAATEPPTQTGGTRGLRELHQFLGEWAVAGIGERRPACGGLGLGARQDGLQTGVRAHLKYLPGLHTDTLCILSCEHRGERDQLLIMYYVCTLRMVLSTVLYVLKLTQCMWSNSILLYTYPQAKFMPYTGESVLVTAARDGQVSIQLSHYSSILFTTLCLPNPPPILHLSPPSLSHPFLHLSPLFHPPLSPLSSLLGSIIGEMSHPVLDG